jgi:hypothetical protein
MNEERGYETTQTSRNVYQTGEKLCPSRDLPEYFQQYARERPEVVAIWCFGIGFTLGWKLKLW